MNRVIFTCAFFASIFLLPGCIEHTHQKEQLKIYGQQEVLVKDSMGQEVIDTVTLHIDSFNLINQDSQLVTAHTFKNKVYVVDFFFTHCPTICPIMTKNMVKIYDHFESNNQVAFLSHTIDLKNDSVPQLKAYANKVGISSKRWHMATPLNKEALNFLAAQYMVSAEEDPNSPGGFMHSGAFILMDQQHRIRGYYDGTVTHDADQLILDIDLLLKETNER